jgi:hypothetical protein
MDEKLCTYVSLGGISVISPYLLLYNFLSAKCYIAYWEKKKTPSFYMNVSFYWGGGESSFFFSKLLITLVSYFIFAWFAVFHNSGSWWSGLFGKKSKVIWCSSLELYGEWRPCYIALSTFWGGMWGWSFSYVPHLNSLENLIVIFLYQADAFTWPLFPDWPSFWCS